jgi:hypothetical protein
VGAEVERQAVARPDPVGDPEAEEQRDRGDDLEVEQRLGPIRPTAFRSPVWAMPTMIVETRSGTIRPLISAMKAFDRKRNRL